MAFYPHQQRPDAISNFVVRFSGASQCCRAADQANDQSRSIAICRLTMLCLFQISLIAHLYNRHSWRGSGRFLDCSRCCSRVSGYMA